MLKRIQEEEDASKKWLRKLTGGLGRNRQAEMRKEIIQPQIDSPHAETLAAIVPQPAINNTKGAPVQELGTWQTVVKLESFDVE